MKEVRKVKGIPSNKFALWQVKGQERPASIRSISYTFKPEDSLEDLVKNNTQRWTSCYKHRKDLCIISDTAQLWDVSKAFLLWAKRNDTHVTLYRIIYPKYTVYTGYDPYLKQNVWQEIVDTTQEFVFKIYNAPLEYALHVYAPLVDLREDKRKKGPFALQKVFSNVKDAEAFKTAAYFNNVPLNGEYTIVFSEEKPISQSWYPIITGLARTHAKVNIRVELSASRGMHITLPVEALNECSSYNEFLWRLGAPGTRRWLDRSGNESVWKYTRSSVEGVFDKPLTGQGAFGLTEEFLDEGYDEELVPYAVQTGRLPDFVLDEDDERLHEDVSDSGNYWWFASESGLQRLSKDMSEPEDEDEVFTDCEMGTDGDDTWEFEIADFWGVPGSPKHLEALCPDEAGRIRIAETKEHDLLGWLPSREYPTNYGATSGWLRHCNACSGEHCGDCFVFNTFVGAGK